ncbi:CidA/LrgA family protein [Pseudomonas sp. NW5]|uniref:CidA/LrgA family protein n=1 Tax=Pseudomonas sp. NW5 TaxID=2934934 RepID=UPI00201FE442|nr:CidA/LrgA family protein [Pseudomonas sp. NW5]MCL7461143.1 CidA/LrgA family protein [Pseudomonas sp. NW5]
MLLRGITWLVLFQLLGTGLNALWLPALPGPILGMLLLLGFLLMRGEVPASVQEAGTALLRYLPLLLVPPAVGVMAYAEVLAANFWALAATLLLSLLISLAFAGWLMQRLITRKARRESGQ